MWSQRWAAQEELGVLGEGSGLGWGVGIGWAERVEGGFPAGALNGSGEHFALLDGRVAMGRLKCELMGW